MVPKLNCIEGSDGSEQQNLYYPFADCDEWMLAHIQLDSEWAWQFLEAAAGEC